MSNLLNNIGIIYKKLSMFKTAEEYFIKSLQERKRKSPNNKQMLYVTHYELGVCLKEL